MFLTAWKSPELQKECECPSVGRWINKPSLVHLVAYYLENKKE